MSRKWLKQAKPKKRAATANHKCTNKEDIRTYILWESEGNAVRETSPVLFEVKVPSSYDAGLAKQQDFTMDEKDTGPITVLHAAVKRVENSKSNRLMSASNHNPIVDVSNNRKAQATDHNSVMKSHQKQTRCHTHEPQKFNVNGNNNLLNYYSYRRSCRKTKSAMLQEQQKTVEDSILSGNEDGFIVKTCRIKGRSVYTRKPLKRGEFVLEYAGQLIDSDKAKRRELQYADSDEDVGCYMYYFKFKNKQYCVDATKESPRLGRLVNHSKRCNLKTQIFVLYDRPHLVLCACRDIAAGEELLYDYGDRSKLSLQYHPWLAA